MSRSVLTDPPPHPTPSPLSTAYSMRQWAWSALVPTMAWRAFGSRALSEPMLGCYQLDPKEKNFSEILIRIKNFHSRKFIWQYRLRNSVHFVHGEIKKQWRSHLNTFPAYMFIKLLIMASSIKFRTPALHINAPLICNVKWCQWRRYPTALNSIAYYLISFVVHRDKPNQRKTICCI